MTYTGHEDEGILLVNGVRDELQKRGLVLWSSTGRTPGPKAEIDDLDSNSLHTPLTNDDHLPLCMIIIKYPHNEDLEAFQPESIYSQIDIVKCMFPMKFPVYNFYLFIFS